jgi:hypothetical protein
MLLISFRKQLAGCYGTCPVVSGMTTISCAKRGSAMTTKRVALRLAVLLGPPIAFVSYLILTSRVTQDSFPTWATQTIAAYFIFSLVVSALGARRQVRHTVAAAQDVSTVRTRGRKVWIVMLVIYGQAALGGLLMFVVLRKVIPWPYGIVAIVINLLFILLLCKRLFWSTASKNS